MHLPQDVVDVLEAVGKGSISAGAEHIARHIMQNSPAMIPKFNVHAPLPTPMSEAVAARKRRDALIYHECLARTFTRKEIAKRAGLSEIRVNQIYAEQSKRPPPFPTSFNYGNLILDAAKQDAADSINDLIAMWSEE